MAAWLAVAAGVGRAARRVGTDARELDPQHRRDGLGLLFIALAIVSAAAVWFGLDGWFVIGLGTVSAYFVGALDLLVPVILLALAWRTLRHPEDHVTNGRLLVGGLATQKLYRCVLEGPKVVSEEIVPGVSGRVRNVIQGPDGAVYVSVEGPGRILRLRAN